MRKICQSAFVLACLWWISVMYFPKPGQASSISNGGGVSSALLGNTGVLTYVPSVGNIAADNGGPFWDDTNNCLGLGSNCGAPIALVFSGTANGRTWARYDNGAATADFGMIANNDNIATGSIAGDFFMSMANRAFFITQDGGTTMSFKVSNGGDVMNRNLTAGGAAPGIAGCSSVIGTGSKNTTGFYTSGTTGACATVLTFATTATTGWVCDISNNTTANLTRQSAYTTTTATLTGVTVSGDVLTYSCRGF